MELQLQQHEKYPHLQFSFLQPIYVELPPMNGQNPPMNGQNPPMNGENPRINGQHPPMNGQYPRINGQYPPMNAQYPQMQGQSPPMNGQYPLMQGQSPPMIFVMPWPGQLPQGQLPQGQQPQGQYPQTEHRQGMHPQGQQPQGEDPLAPSRLGQDSQEEHPEGQEPQEAKKRSGPLPETCSDVVKPGEEVRGIYQIQVDETKFNAFCIPDPKLGPSWTIIQRRLDGTVNFKRDWDKYVDGFGNMNGEYWIGLQRIFELTNWEEMELWIELTNTKNESLSSVYRKFYISDVKNLYTLNIGQHTGSGPDLMTFYNGHKFSTYEAINDDSGKDCSKVPFKGAWWIRNCQGR